MCSPEEEVTFVAYFRRYEEGFFFSKRLHIVVGRKENKFVVRKFGQSEHGKYANNIREIQERYHLRRQNGRENMVHSLVRRLM